MKKQNIEWLVRLGLWDNGHPSHKAIEMAEHTIDETSDMAEDIFNHICDCQTCQQGRSGQ